MRRLAAVLISFAFVGACSNGDSDSTTSSPVTVAPTTTVQNLASDPSVPAVDETRFDASLGAPVDGWNEPVDLAVHDGNTYVVERGGVVSLFERGVRGAMALDISDLTVAGGERGLLGLAFGDTHAFVNYTDATGNTVVDRFPVNADGTIDETTRLTLLTITQPYANHNGGDLVFDASTGSLLVFTGDGGAGGDPERRALATGSLLGKVLRLRDVDNDTVDTPVVPEMAAVGLRNPWRAYLDTVTDFLYIADVGQDHWEEVNVVHLPNLDGSSFGWSAYEGTHEFNTDQFDLNSDYNYVAPVHEYEHVDGRCSISGGAVYRGSSIEFSGSWYVYADFCSGEVIAVDVVDVPGDGMRKLGTVPQPVAVVPDAAGELWVLSLTGIAVPIVAA